MMALPLYLNSSILLGVLLADSGPSPDFREKNIFYSSIIAEVEIFRSLERARFSNRLSKSELAMKFGEANRLLNRVDKITINSEIIAKAQASFPFTVRSLDAIHIASAQWLQIQLGEPIHFWTYDKRQAEAAQCRGLNVYGVETATR